MRRLNGEKTQGVRTRRAGLKRKLITALVAIAGSAVLFLLFLLVWSYFDADFDLKSFIGVRDGGEETTLESEQPSAVTPDALFSDADALNFFVTVDEQKTVVYAALISFSAKENSVKVKPLPGDLRVTFSGRDGKLSELFPDYGAVGLKSSIEAKFGLTVHYYLSFTSANLKNLFELAGDTEVRFDRPTGEFNDNAIKYSYKRGKYTLGPDALYAALKSAFGGDDGVAFRGSVTVDFLQQHITNETVAEGEAAFARVVNLANTDVNMQFYDDYRTRIEAFVAQSPAYSVIN
jgi:anionic cell wall polymer biosynthesis LytR-Cps2A-Psr (LCP) family protein